MFDAADIRGIDHAIQMAIAPAFLLGGLFAGLNVLANRLARMVDRARAIQEGQASPLPGELRLIARRARCANYAIGCSVLAAVQLCLMIVISFIGLVFELLAAFIIAFLLVGAMLALIAALLFFLAEVHLAARNLPSADDPR